MYIDRNIEPWFKKVTSVYDMITLIGPRQAGKTTFLQNMAKKNNASYMSFNDPIAREMFEQDIALFEKQYISKTDPTVLDEIGYCKDPGLGLKFLVDNGNKLWVTSSSEILIGKEVLSYLVGRTSVMRLYQFNIHEFMRARKIRSVTNTVLKRTIQEHAGYGGYPHVVMTGDIEMKRLILNDLVETMVLKDVVLNFSISDERALSKCLRYLANLSGHILQYKTMTNDMEISFKTLKKYIEAFEKSYLIVLVEPFFSKKNKELVKHPKIFFYDTGLRNAIVNEHSKQIDGPLFESYVVTELIKAGYSLKYWRTKAGSEVDLVVEKGNETVPIEVKLTNRDLAVGKGFRSFIRAYGAKKGFVVAFNIDKGNRKVDKCNVIFCDVLALLECLESQ